MKISREARRMLEELQAAAAAELGSRPRLQDIVEAALRIAWRRRRELLEELGAWKPLEDPERLLEELSVDLGVSDSHAEIDEIVYARRGAGRQ